jgi:predicted transcriptional regulator
MTTLKVGIASYEDMKARTLAVARGERRVSPAEPKVWFTSTESFAKVLSAGNRELLRIIAEQAPGSLDDLAQMTGRAKSNLSRTLKTMAGYGLVRLERGERGRITPKVTHDRVELRRVRDGRASESLHRRQPNRMLTPRSRVEHARPQHEEAPLIRIQRVDRRLVPMIQEREDVHVGMTTALFSIAAGRHIER